MSKLLAWFSTKNGRRFTYTCVGITGFSIFSYHLALNGPLQNTVKTLCQIYSNEKPVPLSPSVQQLVHKVLQDSELKREEKKKMQFFNVIGLDLYHSGDARSPFGAMIGLPFMFEDTDKINYGNLRLIGENPIDWIVEGHDLLNALTLSENAKKFAIMREIHSCSIWNVLDSATVGAGSFLFAAEISRKTNAKTNALEKPLKSRLMIYSLCYTLSYFLYRCLRDPTRHLTEKKSDQLSATTSPEYLEGGIEFYEKMLLRNKALRKLMGAKGEREFDKDGNENYFILAPKLPIRKRLNFLKDLQKESQAVTM